MKKLFRIVLVSLGVLIVVVMLLTGALFFAIQQESFQNYLKDKAMPYVEDLLGTRVRLERISVRFPDKLVLRGLLVEDLQGDTLLAVREMAVDVDLWRLLKREVVVEHIGVDGVKSKVYGSGDDGYNYGFLTEVFAADTVPGPIGEDTAVMKLRIDLHTIDLTDVDVRFDDDSLMNARVCWKELKVVIDELELDRGRFALGKVELKNADIEVRMPGAVELAKGINPGHIRLHRFNFKLNDIVYNSDTIAATLASMSFREQSGLVLNQLSLAMQLESDRLQLRDIYLRTPHSRLRNSTTIRFDSIGQLSTDLSKVEIETRISESFAGLRDVVLLAPSLSLGEGLQLPSVIKIDAGFKGTIDRFAAHLQVDSELAGFKARADMTSVDPDALAGKLVLNDIYFYSDSLNMELESVRVEARSVPAHNDLAILLPFAELHLRGNYKLTQLGSVVNNLMVKHYNVSNARYLPEGNQQFELDVRVEDHPFLRSFLPDSLVFSPVDFRMGYNSAGRVLTVKAGVDSVGMGVLSMNGLELGLLTVGEALTCRLNLKGLRQEAMEVPPLVVDGKLLRDVAGFSVLMRDTINGEDNRVSGSVDLAGFRSASASNVGKPGLNLSLTIDRIALKSFEAFAAGSIENTSGYFSGNVDVADLMGSRKITGSLKVNDIAMKILMLGETFRMPSDELKLQEEALVFNSFDIVDEKGEKLTIDGKIGFREFKDFRFDLSVRTDNFRALNSTAGSNDLFFGDLYLGLDLKITGNPELPVVGGQLEVKDKSKLTFIVPHSDPTLTDRSGIVEFVNPGSDSYKREPVVIDSLRQSTFNGMDVGVDIAIDRNAEVTMIIDKATGDFVKLKGEGMLSGGVDPSGKVSLTGRYEFYEGVYELNVSLLQRKFDIRKGSYILWTGDPLSALMNITAEYETRTAPLALVESSLGGVSPEQRNRYLQRLPFITELKVSGELMEPEVGFDIVLDDENIQVSSDVLNTTKAQLARLRTEPPELYKQVVALLLFNQFLADNPLQSSGGGSTGLMIRESAGRIISQQLNSLAGNLIKGVELEFDVDAIDDYTTGVRESRTDLNVALSKQLFDNRLKITVGSSFGLEGTPYENQSSSNIAGNFKADYLITRDGRYKLRAYRKNEYQMALLGEIVETGLTFIITMDYDTWNELIGKK
jgi:hypothetical protein